MILTGPEIKQQVKTGKIVISPYRAAQVNPASYDLRLGKGVAVYKEAVCIDTRTSPSPFFAVPDYENGERFQPWQHDPKRYGPYRFVDAAQEAEVARFDMDPRGWLLQPGILYLMHTEEVVGTDYYVPILDGKSSLARLGVQVHLTAGFGDAGFEGQYTLEVTTVHPVMVYPGMRFCQIRFHMMEGKVQLYRGNYRGKTAKGAIPSQIWKTFQDKDKP